MKKFLLLLFILTGVIQINEAQQIGDGWAHIINNFNSPLFSGTYNGSTGSGLTGGVPDNTFPWQHLFTIRHPNPTNNHQLQLGTSFTQNDRLFFRKIATVNTDGNSEWFEIATRGSNSFSASQIINGEIIWPMIQKNFSAAPREGVNPMSIRLWDNYNGGGPTTYGTLLEIAGRSGHMVSQLYFGGWDNSRIRYREAFYAENQWNEWLYLLDSKNDVESKGNLKITGAGNHYIANGNVGIGTATPLHKFEVYNGGIVSNQPSDQPWGFGIKTSASWGGWGRQYAFFSSDGTQLAAFGGTGLAGNQISSVYIGQGINSTGTEGPRWLSILTTNGNVGIGTTDPKNKLDVNGTIHAREVKVDLIGWADFVFAPTYKLRPLSEVEQFIKTNGHLPEIPKAEDVQQNGVNLGEMQTKLLQKVEELTLYSIEQEKANAALQQQLTIQAQENQELKEEMRELKKLLMKKLK